LSVSDRGRGFDPQELPQAAGFGLLSIRERIELLGGRMTIKSAKGNGSRFFIALPAGTESQDAVGVGPRAYPTSATPGDHGGSPLRVLLADDHEIVRQGLASLLSEEDTIEIVGEAANGREAVDLADQLRPDVVIMDVSMPIMGGDEATRRIKQDLPQTRIISLSMFEDPELREKMYEAGAESYVLKTAPSRELLAAIRGRSPETIA
jgi:CheY-like chemotaxis protein